MTPHDLTTSAKAMLARVAPGWLQALTARRTAYYYTNEDVALWLDMISEVDHPRVLAVAGSGDQPLCLLDRAEWVTGFDIQPRQIAICRAKAELVRALPWDEYRACGLDPGHNARTLPAGHRLRGRRFASGHVPFVRSRTAYDRIRGRVGRVAFRAARLGAFGAGTYDLCYLSNIPRWALTRGPLQNLRCWDFAAANRLLEQASRVASSAVVFYLETPVAARVAVRGATRRRTSPESGHTYYLGHGLTIVGPQVTPHGPDPDPDRAANAPADFGQHCDEVMDELMEP